MISVPMRYHIFNSFTNIFLDFNVTINSRKLYYYISVKLYVIEKIIGHNGHSRCIFSNRSQSMKGTVNQPIMLRWDYHLEEGTRELKNID